MKEELIAPCGINCNICRYYLSKEKGLYTSGKSGCIGCIPRGQGCLMKLGNDYGCEPIKTKSARFCYECREFPCEIVNRLERKYTRKYHTSILGNLEKIKESGLQQFLKDDEKKWKCQACGGFVSMHTSTCFDCGKDKTF